MQTVWWNPTITLANVLARLRLTETDIDQARLTALIPMAGYQINDYLDRTVTPTTAQAASLQDALESLTVALYLPPVQNLDGTYVNPVDMVAGQLTPTRQRWGVA